MTLGDIIKKYREENSVTMEYVAKLCGITKGYVAMLERNINSKTGKPVKPTLETILKVCNGLKLDVDEVFKKLDDDYIVSLPLKKDYFVQTDDGKSFLIELMQEPSFDKFIRLYEYYKALNEDGQEKVAEYMSDLASSVKYSRSVRLAQSVSREIDFLTPVAAHHSSYKDISEEDSKHDLDLLKDDDL